jgi:hypothetical protein
MLCGSYLVAWTRRERCQLLFEKHVDLMSPEIRYTYSKREVSVRAVADVVQVSTLVVCSEVGFSAGLPFFWRKIFVRSFMVACAHEMLRDGVVPDKTCPQELRQWTGPACLELGLAATHICPASPGPQSMSSYQGPFKICTRTCTLQTRSSTYQTSNRRPLKPCCYRCWLRDTSAGLCRLVL